MTLCLAASPTTARARILLWSGEGPPGWSHFCLQASLQWQLWWQIWVWGLPFCGT